MCDKKGDKQEQVFPSWSSSIAHPFSFLIKLFNTPCKAFTACHTTRWGIVARLDFIYHRCHAFQLMGLNMTMQEPISGVIGDKLHYNITTRGDNYRIFTNGFVESLNTRRWCICAPIWCPRARYWALQVKRCAHYSSLSFVVAITHFNHVKTMSMQMDRVGKFVVTCCAQ